MKKGTYEHLFRQACDQALKLAGVVSDRTPVVEFHGRPNPPGQITLERALDLVWLSPNRHFRIIDVAAIEREDNPPVLFVRLSGHEPGAFSETIDPEGLGPFKVMGPASRPRTH